jgi:competence ComEA-like helix-hairpin-helix protein
MKNNRGENPAGVSRRLGPALLLAAALAWSYGALASARAGDRPAPGGFGCREDGSAAVMRVDPESPASIRACPPRICFVLGRPFDINAATAADLQRLDGIGPAGAAAIVAFRDERGGIKDLAELAGVKGLNPRGRANLPRGAEVR